MAKRDFPSINNGVPWIWGTPGPEAWDCFGWVSYWDDDRPVELLFALPVIPRRGLLDVRTLRRAASRDHAPSEYEFWKRVTSGAGGWCNRGLIEDQGSWFWLTEKMIDPDVVR